MKHAFTRSALAILLVLAGVPAFSQDNAVLKKIDIDQLRTILTDLGYTITLQKGGVDIKLADKYQVLLEPFLSGKVLVAGCNQFPSTTLERINQWNDQKALSRAILRNPKTKSFSRLEADIHCELGVTPAMLDGFIKQFGKSLQEFDVFLENRKPDARAPREPAPPPFRRDPIEPTPPVAPKPLGSAGAQGEQADLKLKPRQVEVAFPSADKPETVWKISWNVDPRHGLVIPEAWFKREGRDWIKVLGDCRAAEIHVPYYLSSTRYFDINVGGQASTSPLAITDVLARPGRNLDGKAVLEVRDYGVAWMESRNGETSRLRRGSEVVLWAPLKADWYLYLIEYRFRDDGSIVFRSGSTGSNAPKESHVAHMHNTCWRLDIDLGAPEANGTVRNSVLWSIHKEPGPGQRQAQQAQFESPFNKGLEGGMKWDPEQFAHPRIINAQEKNDLGNPISYEVLPLRAGSARHHQDQEGFSSHDFWVTPYAGTDPKTKQPLELDFRQLPRYVKQNRSIQNQDIVLWCTSSALHVPRDEDMLSRNTPGVTGVVWSGFELRPRDFFSASPLYSRKAR